ncbi:hypothetical protein ACE38V_11760 [Cytobacillus sp. Hz8]|uniref:hypothetical protein n=1 Tax=Cytobacillus sp. Hz8 TaxID=3347168 RepID=UPI0035D7E2A2
MKKKILVATVLSAVLVGGVSLKIYADNDGYELYKEAIIKTHTLNSTTMKVESTVKDNDTTINQIEMEVKYNLQQKLMQGNAAMDMEGENQSFDLAYQNNGFYIKNSDQDVNYLVKDAKSQAEKKEDFKSIHNPELMRIMEHVFDALTVSVHDDFKVINKEQGQKEIDVDLDNGDIPVVFREIGQYMVKKGTKAHENVTMKTTEYPFLSADIISNMPAFVSDIQIDKVKVKAIITKDSIIKNQTFLMQISGKDQQGKKHELEIHMKVDNHDMNQTKLDSVKIDKNKQILLDHSPLQEAHHF